MKKKYLIVVTTCALLTMATVGLVNKNTNGSVEKFANKTSDNDIILVTHQDFPSTSSLDEMIQEADFVVVGKYESFNSSWNMARNPENIQLEDDTMYVEGRLYNFKIDEVLKGEVESKDILVNQKYSTRIVYEDNIGEVVNEEGIVVQEATASKEYSIDNNDFLFIEPEIGSKYMLFLNRDDDMQNYYGAIEPFAIKFDENDVAKLQSNLVADKRGRTLQSFQKTYQIDEDKQINLIPETSTQITDSISGINLEQLIQEVIDNE